ncbi:MAG: carboxypeptidase-like regulatory domain-containing protein [Patescibacteria group bacterium]
MKNIFKRYILTLFLSNVLLLLMPTDALAATITLSPSAGTFATNAPFTVAMIIDEETTAFNAAQAKVVLSENLTVQDMTLGNCDFSFVKTPSVQDLSFVGVTLGGSKQNCTIYSLTLLPNRAGTATITMTDGSVKKYGDGSELLTAVQYGNYEIGSGNTNNIVANIFTSSEETPLVPVSAPATTAILKTEKDLEAYTVSIKVIDEDNRPLEEAVVTLKPQLNATSPIIKTGETDASGLVTFADVAPDIYTVTAKKNDKIIAEQIVNTQGSSPVLTLGLQQNKQEAPNYLGFIVGLAGVILVVLYLFRSKINRLFLSR